MARAGAIAVLAALLAGAPRAQAAAAAAPAPIDLNTADAAQLESLPGIGAARAQRILAWREAHGPFASVDELRQLGGFADATIEKLRPLVTASPEEKRPAKSPRPEVAPGPLDEEPPEGKLNLNLATVEDLQQLAGVTDGHARAILAWRDRHGFFHTVNELAKVNGLPAAVVSTVQYFVTARLDPNTAAPAQLERLGVSAEGAEALVKARKKRPLRGPDDMRLVSGLPVEEREALLPLLWFPRR